MALSRMALAWASAPRGCQAETMRKGRRHIRAPAPVTVDEPAGRVPGWSPLRCRRRRATVSGTFRSLCYAPRGRCVIWGRA